MFRLLIIALSVAAVSSGFTFSIWPFHVGWTTTTNSEQDVEKSIPYMASILFGKVYICSGAIINKRTILTAAHCLPEVYINVIKIGVGLTNRKSHEYLISVTNWTKHENFNSTIWDNVNDIAVVYLAEDIPMKDGKIESISMAEYHSEISGDVEGAIGCWKFLDKNKSETEILKVSSSPLVSLKVCSKLVITAITTKNICAGKLDGNTNECKQDAGSPLVVQQKLVGIVSSGYDCIKFEKPVIYTKISEFRNWIDNKIKM